MTKPEQEFQPLYAVHPGKTLEELLNDRQITQTDLATRMGRPLKTINEIVQGKTAITADTALQLERVLRVSAGFWRNLQRQYEEDQDRVRQVRALEQDANWLDNFPLVDLRRLGHLPDTRDRATLVHYLLRFFGVGNVRAWKNVWSHPAAAFRRSSAIEASGQAIAAWLRAGALEAEQVECAPYDREAFISFLNEARSLTRSDPENFWQPLVDGCRAVGVAVVLLRSFRGTGAYGATQWINPGKAVIQLSNRYRSDDHLWFSFFHEAGHVVLHGSDVVFVEGKDVVRDRGSNDEIVANDFAARSLIPQDKWTAFLKTNPSTFTSVIKLADEVGVSPGIVVGRLQNEHVWTYTQGNGLKRRFTLVDTNS